MSLNLGGEQVFNMFAHATIYDQGMGKIRTGLKIVVAQDGSGDYDDVQTAINNLQSFGGEIFIKEGTYILNKSIQINKDNVSLSGCVGTILQMNIKNIPLINCDHNNLDISNLKLVHTGLCDDGFYLNKTIYCDNTNILRVTNLQIEGTGGGIFASSSTKIYIENCKITNTSTQGHGIVFLGCDDANIKYCYISSTGTSGVGIFLANDGGTNCMNINIDSCKIWDCDAGGIEVYNLNIGFFTKNYIYNNAIGIYFDLPVYYCIMANNSSSGNTTYGILVLDASSDRNIIIGNIAINNSTAQITNNGTNTIIEHNIVA